MLKSFLVALEPGGEIVLDLPLFSRVESVSRYSSTHVEILAFVALETYDGFEIKAEDLPAPSP